MSLLSYLTVSKPTFGSSIKKAHYRSTMSAHSHTTLALPDDLYGATVTLDSSKGDACLIEIIKSDAFQRLHRVLQHGASVLSVLEDELCGGSRVTRYQHSVGAMLLVRRLGASMEEQLAAVSRTFRRSGAFEFDPRRRGCFRA